MNVKKELLKYSNKKLGDFTFRCTPNIDRKTILGVKREDERKIAKALYTSGNYETFLNNLPHKYLEENLVHTDVINLIEDIDLCIKYLRKFLPYFDNWMLTDNINPKSFNDDLDKAFKFADKCLNSKKPYVIRVGIIVYTKFFFNDNFNIKQMRKIVSIKTDHYYVQMMQAWYIAEGLIKKNDYFLPLIKSKKLSKFVQNKSIQKARESFRISAKLKRELLKYKV